MLVNPTSIIIIGETTLLVHKVYLVSAISPSSFKWVLLVPQVSKLSIICFFFLTTVSVIVYVANEIVMRQLKCQMPSQPFNY